MATASIKKFSQLARFSLIYNIAVILWGAYVRASGSGAGCGQHWPLCNGEVIPLAAETKTLIEFTHRITSGGCLILALILYWWGRKISNKNEPIRIAAFWVLIFTLLEAAIGAGLVLLKLVADNSSVFRAVAISLHLVNTLLLLGALTLLTAWSIKSPRYSSGYSRRAKLVAAGLCALIFVAASGAVTALGDTLFPADSLAEGITQDFSEFAHFLVRLRIWHPIIAVVTGCYLLGLVWIFYRDSNTRDALSRKYSYLVAALVVVQFIVGFTNILLLAPTSIQILHLAIADALWIAAVLWLNSERQVI